MTDASHRLGYALEEFEPFLTGALPLPNYEEMTLGQGVNAVASGGGLYGSPSNNRARLPGAAYSSWAKVWLCRGQHGGFTGAGYVLIYRGGPEGGIIARFAICKHESVDDGSDHRRGYHRAHCAKCGLDMSVDSSD